MKARLLLLLRLALGAVFLYAAATKLPDMAGLAENVANYRLVPSVLVSIFATALVGIEIVTGLLLILGVAFRAAAVWSALMLVGFIAALTQALVRHIDLACGCFGGNEKASWETVARDLVMLAAALVLIWLGPGRLLEPRRDEPGTQPTPG